MHPPSTTDAVPAPPDTRRSGPARLPDLMPRRIEDILLVSSEYDSFILEEDGLLTELVFSEYSDLSLTRAPRITRVATGEEALASLRNHRYDLVITMLRLGDMDVVRFSRAARGVAPTVPVVLLIANEIELVRLHDRSQLEVDGIYVWHGDAKLFLAMIKVLEDAWNVDHDTQTGGVGVIIVVEDSVRFRSSLLPLLYTELVSQTRSVMLEGMNRMQKQLRLRARPKILVAESYESAVHLIDRYRDYLFGVISDVRFARDRQPDPDAGIEVARYVLANSPDMPVLLQSSNAGNRARAEAARAFFLHKRSPTFLDDIRKFILQHFGFGDFIFRNPDREEVDRAADLYEMVNALARVPIESLQYHAQRNHFSNWLRARQEFALARRVRPLRVEDFPGPEDLRKYLIQEFAAALRANRRGVVEDFTRDRFDPSASFARIGGGMLGGKARGLAFLDALLARHDLEPDFEDVRIYVPRSVVIGSDLFDRFLDYNQLRSAALYSESAAWLRQQFLAARFPDDVIDDLRVVVQRARSPLAVRSSSMLEDSLHHPFAGIYDTYMIPNQHASTEARLSDLLDAIKLVYASTFYPEARQYLETTPHRVEEQRMAVVLQQIVGERHERYFYPVISGVVRSYNFYPFGGMRPEEGVAMVALGLGKTVVEGGETLRFCPTRPHILPQMSSATQFLRQSQRGFYAIDLQAMTDWREHGSDAGFARLDLDVAERHGTLAPVGSVWSQENQTFYDGIYRPGPRVVTFAHILKSGLFPLADILKRVLDLGRLGMNGPVEIEFAANVAPDQREFAILQMRPYGADNDDEHVEIDSLAAGDLLCQTGQALGHGVIGGVTDIVYVKPGAFDAAATRGISLEVAALNEALRHEGREYLLIGPGRWGSSNHWLGIPVSFSQISSARVIVETALDHFVVDPSQGSHFFHNLVASGIAYLTVHPSGGGAFIDWEWLSRQPAAAETYHVRHVRLAHPLEARIDGRQSRAAVLKHSRRMEPALRRAMPRRDPDE